MPLTGSGALVGTGVLAASGLYAPVGGGGPSRSRGFRAQGLTFASVEVNAAFRFFDSANEFTIFAPDVETGRWNSGPSGLTARWFKVPAGTYTFTLREGHGVRNNVQLKGWNGPSIPSSHADLTIANNWRGFNVGGWYNSQNENSHSWSIDATRPYLVFEFEGGSAGLHWNPGVFDLY